MPRGWRRLVWCPGRAESEPEKNGHVSRKGRGEESHSQGRKRSGRRQKGLRDDTRESEIYDAMSSRWIFKLITNSKNKPSLKECFEITFREPPTRTCEETNDNKPPRRKCKTLYDMHSTQCAEKSLLSDDYENELELYSVLGFNPMDERCLGKVGIYDNETGHEIKSFELGMKLDELCDYTLTLDLDTMVVLVKDERRNFSCYLYRLHFPGLVDYPRFRRYTTRNTVLQRSQRDSAATSNNGVAHNNDSEGVAVPSSSRNIRVVRCTNH
ncbi:hypothetical protein HPB51_017511 [Rhipicephalus microplus]|uniref:Uncharacterized protein n=1 Tax=Rhipicephalus microplus TaxID=6941 RepID=A0A9J6F632_RHIMP|nr:hypothetical protein HPB51_017511 [Rhipicephalus microplus]